MAINFYAQHYTAICSQQIAQNCMSNHIQQVIGLRKIEEVVKMTFFLEILTKIRFLPRDQGSKKIFDAIFGKSTSKYPGICI